MSSDPLAPIWRRLDSEPPVFFADRPDAGFAAARDRLLGLGFVREVEPAQFALCLACGGGHVRRVAWLDDAQAGTRNAYLPCPECGSVRLDPGTLRRWA